MEDVLSVSEDSTKPKPWKGLKGKLFAKDSKDGKAGHAGHETVSASQQQEDVDDFLRPSTNAAIAKGLAAPRLEIPTAKNSRANDPNSLPINPSSLARQRSNSGAINQNPQPLDYDPDEKWKPTKPTRRPGLSVGFTKADPELIGEGGDEAELPPAQLMKERRMIRPKSKSVSHAQPDARYPMPTRKPLPSPPAPPHKIQEEKIDKERIRRSQSARQYSGAAGAALTRIPTGPHDQQQARENFTGENEEIKPLSRVPTGFTTGEDHAEGYSSSEEDSGIEGRSSTNLQPSGTSRFANLRSSPQPHTSRKQPPPMPAEHSSSATVPIRQPRLPDVSLISPKKEDTSHPLEPQDSYQQESRVTSTANSLRRVRTPDALPLQLNVRHESPKPSPGISLANDQQKGSENLKPVLSRSSVESSRSISDQSHVSISPLSSPNRSVSPASPLESRLDHDLNQYLTPPSSSHGNGYRPYEESSQFLGSQDSLMPSGQGIHAPSNDTGESLPRNDASLRRPVLTKQHSSATSELSRGTEDRDPLQAFAMAVAPLQQILLLAAEEVSQPSLDDWLRVANWWFLKGRSGLEEIVQSRSLENQQIERSARDKLQQHHVNFAKTLWIMNEVGRTTNGLQNTHIDPSTSVEARATDFQTFRDLTDAFRRVCASMAKRDLLPMLELPLREGIDISIWNQSGQVDREIAWVLGGGSFSSPNDKAQSAQPPVAMPLGDTEKSFCYGRAFAKASVLRENETEEQAIIPCVVSLVRNRGSLGLSAVISSQSSIMHVRIMPPSKYGITWDHVRWEKEYAMLRVKLPHKFRLHIRCSRKDYDFLFAMYDQDRRSFQTMKARSDEFMMQALTLRSFHYTDTANPRAFPTESIGHCKVNILESLTGIDNRSIRKTHAGYRLAICTSLYDKFLSSISVALEDGAPVDYEFGPEDPNWPPSIRIRILENSRRRTINASFENLAQRDIFRDMITGTILTQEEVAAAKLPLQDLSFNVIQGPSIQETIKLKWSAVRVIDKKMLNTPKSPSPSGESLRAILVDHSGSIIDRLNTSQGELKLRLEPYDTSVIRFLRPARKDISVAAGPSHSPIEVNQALHRIHHMTHTSPTTISYKFPLLAHLHAFQELVTGFKVIFDGVIATWSISRRRKGVPIYRSWDANNSRIQVIQQGNEFQLLAFFNEYVLADCLNFQMKEMDLFEKVDGKNGQPCVKLVDAKFILPGTGHHGQRDKFEVDQAELEKRDVSLKFLALDNLEYAAEHEDITLTFASDPEREAFIKALPAPVASQKKFGLNALKRG